MEKEELLETIRYEERNSKLTEQLINIIFTDDEILIIKKNSHFDENN